MTVKKQPVVRLDFNGQGEKPLVFTNPIKVVSTTDGATVNDCIEEIERWTTKGYYAAGFLSYEASAYLGRDLPVNDGRSFPLIWFGIYEEPTAEVKSENESRHYALKQWHSETNKPEYLTDIERVHNHIRCGDTYQVNYTMRLSNEWMGNAYAYYEDLKQQQSAAYSAFLDLGNYQVLSVSPELFFKKTNNRIVTKPMKGTIARGRNEAEDQRLYDQLYTSSKDRAENVMIVDLLRNDLGAIAQTGSVKVSKLFELEQYPTVWQMTSEIECDAKDDLSIAELLRTLFPCGSITGAPKKETMKIIRALERSPREMYCGSIGYFTPEKDACFNVAIRTVTINESTMTYGVGGGVTWDSTGEGEYEEAMLKADVVERVKTNFNLLESLQFKNGHYPYLLDHLLRLKASSDVFGRRCEIDEVREALALYSESLESDRHYKVRLSMNALGRFSISHSEVSPPSKTPLSVAFAISPVIKDDRFLQHKTTERSLYERLKSEVNKEVFDVLLFNEQNEVTEFTIGNVVVEKDGRWVTPPQSAGLLPGIFRQRLLDQNVIVEGTLSIADVRAAQNIWLINSVREWVNVQFV